MTNPASTPITACPQADELERFIGEGESDQSVREHVERCESCREQCKAIRDNLEFMQDFLSAVAPTRMLAREARLPPPTPDELPGYRLTHEIGRGGQGVVYDGVQLETHRRVAVKMIDPMGSGGGLGRRARHRLTGRFS